jgi:predicted secreted protein
VYIALVVLGALAPGCASAPVPGPSRAALEGDRDLTVSEGTTFTVALDGHAGTGYRWMVAGADADTVALVERSVERPGPAMPGAAEREVFVFLARRSGTVTLRFTYARPGADAAAAPARAYRVQVIRC